MTLRRTPKLDRAQVVDTALRLLNEVGLDGLTLRAIATELDVKAPALYWHFKDKQALLDEMATEIMRRMTAEAPPPAGDWRQEYLATMRTLRAHLLRYRDGARVYSGARFTDTSYAPGLDAALRVLIGAGFSPAAAARAWQTAYSYTIGYVVEEQAMGPNPFAGEEGQDVEARAERLAAHPLAAEAGRVMFQDFDLGYEQGLAAVLAGVEATLLA
ncbi:TetR/AcrR family transcriptional regulator C-terminal domain-containing protein [Kitasatospora sp. SUK 42]|uniref:TetR/AcrR family transcriptional regulator C-terminal domain-containing protein n=1 Tax=Kitasatospora sp. SUK 42 TaxID=1588882 RepID=UPI0018C98448|nr:TetR/AcrR family transcriptional regulator C-terminal domain-containing protein [Kitasatospora sp. SUK 42]MBV2155376.1 TetR/AcrR family transcriptional regulator C-terminal domain-containing protein [Kitasatospora sp. SUK 42]